MSKNPLERIPDTQNKVEQVPTENTREVRAKYGECACRCELRFVLEVSFVGAGQPWGVAPLSQPRASHTKQKGRLRLNYVRD